VARRFSLHQHVTAGKSFPAVTLLKPLKGRDESTEACLRSWLAQVYPGPVQILFAVASAEDPVCPLVRDLLREFPKADAQLVVCGPFAGTNLKVSKLMQLESLVKHELNGVSDADVLVPGHFLANVVPLLEDSGVGLINCFYRLANPTGPAMWWEAVAINTDFWSQVLQSQSLKPLDFALGAVMLTRREQLREIGGFAALADCLADDYQLGRRVSSHGHGIVLSSVVVECWSAPMGWKAVWKHQLRWARTIRVCQPVPYFFSILSNATLWPALWFCLSPAKPVLLFAAICLLVRIVSAIDLQNRLTQKHAPMFYPLSVLLKDVLQVAIWLLAFLGNRIEWRGELMRLRADGTLERNSEIRRPKAERSPKSEIRNDGAV
jgi:ceramide glucosyltransferase